jgi:hypothetical protein
MTRFMVRVLLCFGCLAIGGLAGCGSTHLSSNKLLSYAGVAAVAYIVFDPIAPNWQIDEAKLAEDRYVLQLRMKHFHTGGDGESRVVFNRRAEQLASDNGYASYQILSYSEGIKSTLPAAQRVSEGVIQLVARNP